MKKLIISALFLFSINAHAEFISGNKLLQYMTSESEVEKGFGFGYVAGVFDLGVGTTHCAPQSVTIKQISDMTKNALESLPQHRDKSADQFVNTILKTTWPCKNKSSSRERQT